MQTNETSNRDKDFKGYENQTLILLQFFGEFWQTQSRQSRSKSKADNLVFIKIVMSNQPPIHPQESFKDAR